MSSEEDETPEVAIHLLTPDELVERSREVATFAIEQCPEDCSGPFALLSSMAVLLAGAASLAAIGRVEPEAVVLLLRQLIETHYETARKDAN